MKLSPFFKDLSSAYAYEIEDLRWDSAGGNVLKSRLKDKRDAFASLLPLIESFPVLVAPAFHGAFGFRSKDILDQLVASKPGAFPRWETVAAETELAPWAQDLALRALGSAGGEYFMLVAAGLEYILSGLGATASAGEAEVAPRASGDGEEDEGDGGNETARDEGVEDLGDAGEDYLEQQGFDRRS